MADPYQRLRDDVRLLGERLGDVLTDREGAELFALVEEVRALSKRAHAGEDRAFDNLADLLRELPIGTAFRVARAFAHFLTLANIAEQHHRIRRRREHARDPRGRPQRASCDETFARLRKAGVPAAALADAARAVRIELVLTAHPTEIVRRTVLQIHHRLADLLGFLDRTDLTPPERADTLDAVHREIASLWQTDEVRHERISPIDEVRAGLVVFQESLWNGVPQYLRALDRALVRTTGVSLPIDAAPIRFGSWIGGDRDGNPNVTPEVTRQATWLARWVAASLYLGEVRALRAELSLKTASDELRERVGDAREPYRALLRVVRDRLAATLAWAEASLAGERVVNDSDAGPAPYCASGDLREPLALCDRSLRATGNDLIASGRLADILRRLAVFGITMARLDLRQEASRHTEALEWIASQCGWGRYTDASEAERQAILVRELDGGRAAIADLPIATAGERVRDVLDTFRMAATLDPESLGAYIITMASRPSDVLAVELLQRMARQPHRQRVVPLFETADDLRRAGEAIDALLGVAWYRRQIHDRQEVMVGYSDSSKEAGRLAAAWALYRAQEDVVSACERHGVTATFFHGRGGSIGRGGGPTYLAIQSQPPQALRPTVSDVSNVSGVSEASDTSDTSGPPTLRITEQGETIEGKFGLVDITVRTLEVYTTAVIAAMVAPHPAARSEWRTTLDAVASVSRAAYRSVVYDTPEFADYFHAATPEPELAAVNIGSRPARRPGAAGGVASLRAIPWQFAWTQTRVLLPSWLGVEAAIAEADVARLRDMYRDWPFFRSTIDLIAIALAEGDARIAAQYDRLAPAELRPIGVELRRRFASAVDAVLDVMNQRDLLHDNRVLRRSIDVRNPYVDPINLVQIELLRRLRAPNPDPQVQHAFAVTVSGIAAGMRNTG